MLEYCYWWKGSWLLERWSHSNSRFFNRQHILLVWWTGVSTDDLYSYVYELYSTTRQFVSMCLWGRLPSRAPKNKDSKSAHAFNSSFRYIDDVLSPNSSRFCHYSYPIYTIKLEVNDTTDIQKFASCLDLHIEIDNGGRLNTTLYDKRYDFTLYSDNRTIQKNKKMSNTDPTKKPGWTQVFAKGKQFLLHIRHPPCYLYIQ
jgi:hypothetical protein